MYAAPKGATRLFLRECVMDVSLSQFSRHGIMVSFGHWPTLRSAFLTNLVASQLVGNCLQGLQNLSKEFQDPPESIKENPSLVSYVMLLVEGMCSAVSRLARGAECGWVSLGVWENSEPSCCRKWDVKAHGICSVLLLQEERKSKGGF